MLLLVDLQSQFMKIYMARSSWQRSPITVMLPLFISDTFIFMVTDELGYISLYSSPPCSCCISYISLLAVQKGLPACSLALWYGGDEWQPLGFAMPADGFGGESMLMAYCFKAFTGRNL